MAVTNQSYALNMYCFKEDNPSPESSLATLEIQVMSRYIIQLQLNQQQQQELLGEHFYDDEVVDVEHVVSPVFNRCVAIPSHLLALPLLRKLCVTEVLRSFGGEYEGSLYECLMPEVERFLGEAVNALGLKEFGVVAEVYVATIDVIDHQGALSLLAN